MYRTGSSYRALFTAALFLAATWANIANAQQSAPRFCIVPVRDGAPTAADVGNTWRITIESFEIPGLAAPVFTPVNRRGQWTIDSDRRLVRYDGPFPKTGFDRGHWVEEPWDKRIVAATYAGGVSILRPGSGQFVQIAGPSYFHGGASYNGVYMLPRRKLTLVIPSNGMPLAVDGETLRAWLTPDELKQQGMRGLTSALDAPSLRATIVLDVDRHVRVLDDDDTWSEVGSIDKDDSGRVVDTGDPDGVLFVAARSVLAIRRIADRGSQRFAAKTLATAPFNAGWQIAASPLFHQALTYAGTWPLSARWRRLGPRAFVDIEGGDVGIAFRDVGAVGNYHDLPSLKRGVIQGKDGLFLYDGNTITPVVNSGPDRVDYLAHIYDLQSIGRVIVTSRKGLFELTADGQLVDRPMPFPTEGLAEPAVADWPEAGVAVLSTKSGMFVLDRNLNAEAISGGIQLGFAGWRSPVQPLPSANGTELLLTARPGLFLLIDGTRSSSGACQQPAG
jgi:hypothetical protein